MIKIKKAFSTLIVLGLLPSSSLFTSCQKECASEHYGYFVLNNNTTRTIYAESGDGLFYWGPFNSNSIGDIISLTWVFGDAGFNSDQDIAVTVYVYDTAAS